MEAWLHLLPQGGVTMVLVAATFVLPGLVVIALEAARGHELMLAGYTWAAAALPVTVSLAGYFWKMGALRDPSSVEAAAEATIILGLVLSGTLVILGFPARLMAKRRRRPIAPMTASKAKAA